MHIEPLIPDFDHVTIRRTGGIMGVDETLHLDSNLAAVVKDRHRGDRTFELDAYSSHELMVALSRLLEVNPGPSSRTGADLFHYDIELSVGGQVKRFRSVDLGADEALHGVMLAARNIGHTDQNPFHTMALHVVPEHA